MSKRQRRNERALGVRKAGQQSKVHFMNSLPQVNEYDETVENINGEAVNVG